MKITWTIKFYFFITICLINIPISLCKVYKKIRLQWSICDLNPQIVLQKLGKEDLQPFKTAPISYFDTDPPHFITKGLMLRKKFKSNQEYSLVKKKFNDDSIKVPGSDCSWYRYGDNIKFVCMMYSPINNTTIWSQEQVRLVENYYKIDWDNLVEYGPYMNTKWKSIKMNGYKVVFDDVVAESNHLMEIEAKVSKHKGHSAYKSITNYLLDHGIVLCDHQETKSLRLFRRMGYFDMKNTNNGQNHQNQKSFLSN